MEKGKEKKINLKEIPQGSCKILDLENKRVAICHEPNGEFSFFELKPIENIHTYEADFISSKINKNLAKKNKD
ncbi:MAG: hypothetical protein ACTSVV_01665 [Promethearchaeota archaeon]